MFSDDDIAGLARAATTPWQTITPENVRPYVSELNEALRWLGFGLREPLRTPPFEVERNLRALRTARDPIRLAEENTDLWEALVEAAGGSEGNVREALNDPARARALAGVALAQISRHVHRGTGGARRTRAGTLDDFIGDVLTIYRKITGRKVGTSRTRGGTPAGPALRWARTCLDVAERQEGLRCKKGESWPRDIEVWPASDDALLFRIQKMRRWLTD
jgi:hypothetical protein